MMKILVADDDRSTQDMVADLVRAQGHEPVVVADGAAACLAIEHDPNIRVAVLNWMMPELTGIEVCRWLRRRQTTGLVYAIILTSRATKEDVVVGLESGANDYLVKPVDPRELKSRLAVGIRMVKYDDANRESQEYYRSLFEGSRDAILLVDEKSGKCLAANRAALQMFGASQMEQMLNHPVWEFAPPCQPDGRDSQSLARQYLRSAGRDENALFEWQHTRLNGDPFHAEVLLGRIATGTHGVIQAVVRDITARKQAEQERTRLEKQLLQAQKLEAIGTLASGIAHDFNNVLNMILGFAELIRMEVEDNRATESSLLDHTNEIIQAAGRAGELVAQILSFSSQAEIKLAPVHLRSIVRQTAAFLRKSMPATIEIKSSLSVQEDVVMANPSQLHQVILNLCVNAMHAMRERGGVLTLKLTEEFLSAGATRPAPDLADGPYLRLSVADTGHGIPEAILDRIFDPYFTTKPPGEGSGIGLAVVQGIVKSLKGAITVQSTPGKGACFDVWLPRHILAVPETQTRPQPSEIPKGRRERILLVDDEPNLVKATQAQLQRMGYVVTGMTNSRAAAACFQRNPSAFDLVLTDMTMPGMTGLDLARVLTSARPDLPVLLMTGYSDQLRETEARKAGIKRVMRKPLDAGTLSRAVHAALHSLRTTAPSAQPTLPACDPNPVAGAR